VSTHIACPGAAKVISSVVMHWDFALILLFLATAVPLLGRRRIRQLMQMPETTKRDRLRLYASTIAFQWIAAAVILWRTGAHGIAGARLGLAIPSPALTAIVTGVLAALVLTNQIVSLRMIGTRPAEAQGVLPQLALKIFPQDSAERLVFFAVVVTVAICEELIYRGFVQRVFEDWSGGLIAAGIFGSAVMFAIAHFYQGRRGVITTCVVGLLFATVRAWTGSLLAPLVAHFIADIMAGFLAPARLRAALANSGRVSSTSAVSE
jgi:membrane protease YdiL (CAAX protease family)